MSTSGQTYYSGKSGKATYIPSTGLVANPTVAPTLASSAGGTMAATTYYVVYTYTDAQGQTVASPEASLAVAADYLLTVTSPAASTNATGYNVYVGTATGQETLQNSSPIALGTNWTEPTSGLIAGTALPTINSTAVPVQLPVKQWNATHTATGLDSTNTKSAGYQNITGGIQKLDGSCDLLWDGSATNDTPPNIQAGSYVNLQLYPVATLTNPISVPSAFIESANYKWESEQLVTVTIQFKSDGAFTMPNGT
jgi:hypothetical protein